MKIIARRVPDAVVKLLRLYSDERLQEEPVTAFYQRVDPKRVIAVLGELLAPAVDGEDADIGEERGFLLHTGAGECAA